MTVTFFDQDMQAHDVTMQELQLAAQEQYNYSLIGEQPESEFSGPIYDSDPEYALD